jgi:predicted alpha/beta superfamily hydrolase
MLSGTIMSARVQAAEPVNVDGLVAVPAPAGVFSGTYLGETERFRIRGAGADYDVWVALPRGYAASGRRYPLLLVLDGRSQFALAAIAARLVNDDGAGGEAIVVGISTAGPELAHEIRRLKDYTPDGVPPEVANALKPLTKGMFARYGMPEAQWKRLESENLFGGGSIFLNFVTGRLLPALEARYRVDTSALGLAGHSAGGAFASYALLQGAPFTRYIIGSYTVAWYGDQLPALEAAFALRNDTRRLEIYESHGDGEVAQLHVGDAFVKSGGLLDRLATLQPRRVTVIHRVVEAQGHSGSIPTLYAGGIRALYPAPGR